MSLIESIPLKAFLFYFDLFLILSFLLEVIYIIRYNLDINQIIRIDIMHLDTSLRERQNEFNRKLARKAKEDNEFDCIKCLTSYVNIHTPIKFECKQCGLIFTRNPVSIFKNKYGICPNHARKISLKNNNKQEHYHKRLVAKEKRTGEYGKIIQLTPYRDWNHKIEFRCLDCGQISVRKPSSVYGCHYICRYKSKMNKRKKSHQSQIFTLKHAKELVYKQVGNEYKILSNYYINSQKKLIFIHCSTQCIYFQRHRTFYRFQMTLSNFLMKHRCPKDGEKQSHDKFRKTTEAFKREVKNQRDGDYLVKSRYINNRQKVLMEHHSKKCFYYQKHHKYYQWWTRPTNFIRFHSICPKDRFAKVAKNHRNSLVGIKKKIASIAGKSFRVLSKTYKNEYKKICLIHQSVQCPYYQRYGKYYRFYVSPTNFYANPTCPYDNISCGEKAIMLWLNKHGLRQYIDYYYAYILKDHFYTKRHQHLDFYLPKVKYDRFYINGIGIEFDGIQHFKSVDFSFNHNHNKNNLKVNVLRDKIKNKYCYNHGIKLIRIENRWDYQGKRLRQLVKSTLNQRLLNYL